MSTRLQQLRTHLRERETDLQRTYNFQYRSTKLLIANAHLYITSFDHPNYTFENTGDYRGYITSVTKPSEIGVTFLEDSKMTINSLLEMWDQLKYNQATGIHYPKAVYEDQGILNYFGPEKEDGKPVKYKRKNRSYIITGFYPIGRPNQSLSYDSNDVVRITVPFNVDSIIPTHMFGKGL